jgi:hypothetical protein
VLQLGDSVQRLSSVGVQKLVEVVISLKSDFFIFVRR